MNKSKNGDSAPDPTTSAPPALDTGEDSLPPYPSPFEVGEAVLANHRGYYYLARVEKVDLNKEWIYLIHYPGWGRSGDEWVGVDRLLKKTEENLDKVAHGRKQTAGSTGKRPKNNTTSMGKKAKREHIMSKGKDNKSTEKTFSISISPTPRMQQYDDCEFVNHMGKEDVVSTTVATQSLMTAIVPATEDRADASTKLEIAMEKKRLSQSHQPQQSVPQPSSFSFLSSSSTYHWKRKAKDRKQEVLRLKQELKNLEDDLCADLYPQSVSWKCYFFNQLQNASPNMLKHMSDHNLNDFRQRRFIRQVRSEKRIKRMALKSIDRVGFAESNRLEETEKLKLSAEFLVDHCDLPNSVKTPHFANLSHQAADFILGSLIHILSIGKDAAMIEGIISGLIARLVKRMCSLQEDELYCDPESDAQILIQHILRQLGSVAYIGQRILLSVCNRISRKAEILVSLDPFDESFALTHDAMFVMIQLVEFLVSDYLVTWSKDEGFETGLSEEWLASFLDARKGLQLMEKRSSIYGLYMDKVTGEIARRLGQS